MTPSHCAVLDLASWTHTERSGLNLNIPELRVPCCWGLFAQSWVSNMNYCASYISYTPLHTCCLLALFSAIQADFLPVWSLYNILKVICITDSRVPSRQMKHSHRIKPLELIQESDKKTRKHRFCGRGRPTCPTGKVCACTRRSNNYTNFHMYLIVLIARREL